MPRPNRAIPALVLFCALLATMPAGAGAVEWRSWNAGLSHAKQTRRYVLVDVYTDWCGWCKRMDKEVYARADVGRYLDAHFSTIRLNAESGEAVTWQGRSYTARSLATEFGVSGYPATLFLAPNANHLATVPGYIPADRFLLLLRFIGDGHMDRGETWDDYVKRAGGERRGE